MIVQFSVNPMDSEHISGDVAKITGYLEEAGIEYKVGPIGTSIQGNWDDVMPVIKRCHQIIAINHARVLTHITIDDHKDKEYTLDDTIQAELEGSPNSTTAFPSRDDLI